MSFDIPYKYQRELFESAITEDIIVVLPTGAGKTRIASLLINYYLKEIKERCSNQNHQVIAFLTPTKALVSQQFKYIRHHMSEIKDGCFQIKEFTGITKNAQGVHIDDWSSVDWDNLLRETHVIVMTPQIFYDALRRAVIGMTKVSLVVLDECHHVKGNTPEMNVCKMLIASSYKPRVLGLTASPKDSKKGTLEDAVTELERAMGAICKIVPDEELKKERDHKLPSCSVVSFESNNDKMVLDDDSILRIWNTQRRESILPNDSISVLSHAFVRMRNVEKLVTIYKDLALVNCEPLTFSEDFINFPASQRYSNRSECYLTNHKLSFVEYNCIRSFSKILRSVANLFDQCGAFIALQSIAIAFSSMLLDCGSGGSTIDTVKIIETLQYVNDSVFSLDILLKAEESICYCMIDYLYAILKCFPNHLLLSFHNDANKYSFDQRLLSTILRQDNLIIKCGDKCVLNSVIPAKTRLNDLIVNIVSLCHRLSKYISVELLRCDMNSLFCKYQSLEKIANMEEALEYNSSKDTTLNNKLVSMKIKMLTSVLFDKPSKRNATINNELSNSSLDDSQISISIVFCDEKLCAMTLKEYFDLFYIVNFTDKNSNIEFLSQSLIGSNNITTQNSTLQTFRTGDVPILFATTVAEEGIDVRDCELVVNFDLPKTSKSYLQRRGRARAQNSHYVTILSVNDENLNDAELMVEFYNQTIEQDNYQIKRIQRKSITIIDDNDDVYITPVGAKATVESSKELLFSFCDSLRKDDYDTMKPIYDITTHAIIGRKECSYYCSILLPHVIPANLRCVVGPECISKSKAEGKASLMCIKRLHEAGEMTDRLYSIYTKSNSDYKFDLKDAVTSDNIPYSLDGHIKTTPEILKPIDDNQLLLHFYRLDKQFVSEDDMKAINSCRICTYNFESLDEIGIAFLSELPSSISNLNMPWNSTQGYHIGFNANIRYIRSFVVTKLELYLMQRYHKALVCWESEGLFPDFNEWKSYEEYSTKFEDFFENSKPSYINHSEWTSSSNGCWYLLYPKPSVLQYHLEKQSVDPKWRFYWDEQLKVCANESQLLVHNLHVQNNLKFTSKENLPSYNAVSKVYSVNHILSRGRERLCHIQEYNKNDNTLSFIEFSSVLGNPICSHTKKHFDLMSKPLEQLNYSVVLGKSEYYYIGLISPFVSYRLISALLVAEAKQYLITLTSSKVGLTNCPSPSFIYNNNNKSTFYKEIMEIPDDSLMIALTCNQCSEKYNYQLVEFIGDTILKYITSIQLYLIYPNRSEGYLTNQRKKYINNYHLAKMCLEYHLDAYLRVIPCYFDSKLTYLPPGKLNLKNSLWNQKIVNNLTFNPQVHSIDKNNISSHENIKSILNVQKINGKVYADLVESIIGLCYLHGGINLAIEIMKAFHCYPTNDIINSNNYNDDIIISNSRIVQADILEVSNVIDSLYIPSGFPIYLSNKAMGINLSTDITISSNNIKITKLNESERLRILNDCNNHLYIQLGYKFDNLDLLNEALTHSSSNISKNNQRLEYLGDAVLDFAVISSINIYDYHSEGELHDYKQSKTNNIKLFELTNKLKLQNYIICSKELEFDIKMFNNNNTNNNNINNNINDLKLMKPLADLFESLIGAIYLDSKYSIETIRRIIKFIKLID